MKLFASDVPPPKKSVDLVITDLDDTIWDWLKMWHNSFEPFLKRIAKECRVDLENLKGDFRSLHQKYHTSECSFIYQEISSITPANYNKIDHQGNDPISILHEYYRNKKDNLELYDGAYNTLVWLKSKGVRLVGFTESQIFYTKYRLKHLGLDGIFDVVYTNEDHELPETVVKTYKPEVWEVAETELKQLPPNFKKPNSEILKKIVYEQCGSLTNTIYIGDKLDRDVFMAQKAGIYSVHAKYGQSTSSRKYELLKAVSHWSDDEITREESFQNSFDRSVVKPNLVLEESFSEIARHFDFIQFAPFDRTHSEIVQKAWEKAVDVQQHFNDIELRIRNLSLTAFTFIITGIGFLYKEDSFFVIWGFSVHSSVPLGIVGCAIIFLFFLMDKFWYHRLLLGSVYHAMFIEERWKSILPELHLSNAVKNVSEVKAFGVTIRSSNKISLFYYGMILILFSISILMIFRPSTQYNLEKMYSQLSKIEFKGLEQVDSNAPRKGGIVLLTLSDSVNIIESTSDISKTVLQLKKKYGQSHSLRPKIKYMYVAIGREELRDYVIERIVK